MIHRSPCHAAEESAGARFDVFQGLELPRRFADIAREVAVARSHWGLVDRGGMTVLRVSRQDARDYLHRRLSNSVNHLPPGGSCYATLHGGDGRKIADLHILRLTGTEVFAGDKKTGIVKRVVESLAAGGVIGPGTVKWEFREPGMRLECRTWNLPVGATVSGLPFVVE
jgi:glycine cleavage system aminomethyltransferase T